MWRGACVGAAGLTVACGGSGSSLPIIPPYWTSGGIVVSDLDGDGRADVAIARTYIDQPPPHPGYVDVQLQTAPGRFAPLQRYPVAADPWVLSAGDIDGDGLPDLLAASPMALPPQINTPGDSGALALLRQTTASPGQFEPAQVLAVGGVAADAAIAEVSGDGRTDLLVADGVIGNSRALLLLQQPAAATFSASQPVCTGAGGWSALAVGDLDGDAQPDVAGVGGGNLWWCRGLGGGNFGAPAVLGTGVALVGIALADLDADGRLDIVAADAGNAPSGGLGAAAVRWWRQTAPGVFTVQSQSVSDGARRVVVQDLNQDGRADMVVISTVYQTQANSTRISVLLQSATVAGAFGVSQVWQGPYGASFVAVGEVTGDGRVDIVVEGPLVYPQSSTDAGTFLSGVPLP
jgi:hypothetical protein